MSYMVGAVATRKLASERACRMQASLGKKSDFLYARDWKFINMEKYKFRQFV